VTNLRTPPSRAVTLRIFSSIPRKLDQANFYGFLLILVVALLARAERCGYTEKKWFCYGNTIRGNKLIFCCCNKNFAAATKRFVDRTKHFVVVTKYFCYPNFNKLFSWYNKALYEGLALTPHRIFFMRRDI